MALTNRQIDIDWQEFRDSVKTASPIDQNETPEQQRSRVKLLESDFEKWVEYYFSKYAYAKPAKFHKQASKRLFKSPEWYEVRNWSRELAKDTRLMFEILYTILVKKTKKYVVLISASEESASELLEHYRSQLDSNQRLINDYGQQQSLVKWREGDFKTRGGVKFKACGAGQTPRGTKNFEVRPDVLIINDIDTDEDVRNEEIINKRWKWIEKAAIGTRSISKPTWVIFLGNIIAPDCCVVRAQKFADYVDIINIRDEFGKSTWPEKNTEENIDRVLSKISYNAQQAEYFNNPIEDGNVFDKMTWGRCPPLHELQFIVQYADPSTSSRDKPKSTSKQKNSCKANVIIGYLNGKYYIYKAWVDITTNDKFITWLYDGRDYVANKTALYSYIENNGFQNPFFQQALLPMVYRKADELKKPILPLIGDDREKPEKFFRIESRLEPLDRNGQLIFNEDEKNNPHMQTLESQFKSVSPNSRTMDGPDAVEGGVYQIEQKIAVQAVGSIKAYNKPKNKKRY